jgi:hypothetical protein
MSDVGVVVWHSFSCAIKNHSVEGRHPERLRLYRERRDLARSTKKSVSADPSGCILCERVGNVPVGRTLLSDACAFGWRSASALR